jgi:hypothetical protein
MTMTRRWLSFAVGTGLAVILASGPLAQAQVVPPFARTWVSGVGDDQNAPDFGCARIAPCRTFAGAVGVTAPGGEVDVLDPGGFGAVRITRALTIDGTDSMGSILATSGAAVTINAGPNDDVVLRGLSFNGARLGVNGIRFNSGRDLHVEHVAIERFITGIDFEPTGTSDLVVRDSNISNNRAVGILSTSGGGSAHVTIDNSRIAWDPIGVSARTNSIVSISNSVFTGNGTIGLLLQPDTGAAEMNVVDSMVVLGGVGIQATGQATIRLSHVTSELNYTGIKETSGGVVYTYVDNRIVSNFTANGAPNAPATPTPTATAVPTPTATPVPTLCRPRPNIGVKVWPVSQGRLAVSITANVDSGTADNALTELRFTSTDNGNVDIENIVGGWGNFTVPLPSGTRQEMFFVNRIDGAFATTVNLIVHDRCGDWPTSVGGGPGAF